MANALLRALTAFLTCMHANGNKSLQDIIIPFSNITPQVCNATITLIAKMLGWICHLYLSWMMPDDETD